MKTPREQILSLAAEALDMRVDQIQPDAPWQEYGGDSLAVVEMVLTVQEHFGIALETPELAGLMCMDDLVRVVERKLGS